MLRLDRLTKRFGDVAAVSDLSLEVAAGEFVTLLGPSGCGKTTTLRMIAGFESPTGGRILLDGDDVTRRSPQTRGIGMVFQNYALFPHLDVFENVAFGLKAQGVSKSEIPDRVARALELVDLAGYEKRRVQQLSGGQQQRIALARALAPEPPVLLLDEPLSNLDAALRERTRAELRRLLKRLGVTVVFVTHDQEEAFALSDRIALLDGGRLQQLGTPETLYDEPANAFVASFVGQANFLAARALDRRDDGTLFCELPGGARWRARRPATMGGADDGAAPHAESGTEAGPAGRGGGRPRAARGRARAPAIGEPVRLMIRPEAVRLDARGPDSVHDRDAGAAAVAATHGPDRDRALAGSVEERRFAGAVTYYRVRTKAGTLLALGAADLAAVGDDVTVAPADESPALAYPPAADAAADAAPAVPAEGTAVDRVTAADPDPPGVPAGG